MAPAQVIALSVRIAAAPDAVWRAFADPEQNGWLGSFRFESTFEAGAPLTLRGELNGKPYAETGVVLAAEPGKRLRYEHFSRLWRVSDTAENRARLEFGFEPDAGGTRVELRHELPDVLAIAEHSRFFWMVSLERLRMQLEGAPTP